MKFRMKLLAVALLVGANALLAQVPVEADGACESCQEKCINGYCNEICQSNSGGFTSCVDGVGAPWPGLPCVNGPFACIA